MSRLSRALSSHRLLGSDGDEEDAQCAFECNICLDVAKDPVVTMYVIIQFLRVLLRARLVVKNAFPESDPSCVCPACLRRMAAAIHITDLYASCASRVWFSNSRRNDASACSKRAGDVSALAVCSAERMRPEERQLEQR